MDACEQYVGQKVLRITTYVKPKTDAAAIGAGAPKATPISVDRGTSTSSASPPIHIQDVLESFVGVLSTAVNHLQEGLSAKSSKNPMPSVARAAASTEENEAKEEQAAKKPEEKESATKKVEEDSKVPAAGKKPAAEPSSEDEEERLFIHGRHTCDSCLSTPIIGTRYHATNVR